MGVERALIRKNRISVANTGKKHTPEACKKISEAGKGRIPWNKDKKMGSSEKKGKTYEEMYGVEKGNEIKKKVSEGNKGKIISEDIRERTSFTMSHKYKGVSWDERYGVETANEMRIKVSVRHQGHIPWNKDVETGIEPIQKGKTWEEVYGESKAKEMKKHLSDMFAGKSWEELYGTEKAALMISKFSGENNRCWIDGNSVYPYPSRFNEELKEYIRDRDNYTCLLCNEKQNGRKHSVHHIDYDKENSDPLNLITLCKSCHGKTNHDRECWSEVLARVVEGMYCE